MARAYLTQKLAQLVALEGRIDCTTGVSHSNYSDDYSTELLIQENELKWKKKPAKLRFSRSIDDGIICRLPRASFRKLRTDWQID